MNCRAFLRVGGWRTTTLDSGPARSVSVRSPWPNIPPPLAAHPIGAARYGRLESPANTHSPSPSVSAHRPTRGRATAQRPRGWWRSGTPTVYVGPNGAWRGSWCFHPPGATRVGTLSRTNVVDRDQSSTPDNHRALLFGYIGCRCYSLRHTL